jgi:hypothetical protein
MFRPEAVLNWSISSPGVQASTVATTVKSSHGVRDRVSRIERPAPGGHAISKPVPKPRGRGMPASLSDGGGAGETLPRPGFPLPVTWDIDGILMILRSGLFKFKGFIESELSCFGIQTGRTKRSGKSAHRGGRGRVR